MSKPCGYLDAATKDIGIKDDRVLGEVLSGLADKVHPLVLGEIFRSRAQIRFLAEKLLNEHVAETEKRQAIIDFLCADSGSHDYTINRREAEALGLSVEKPSAEFYDMLKALHKDYAGQMELAEPFDPVVVIGAEQKKDYRLVRGLIESVDSGSFGFVTQGEMRRSQVQTPMGVQEQIEDRRIFEGWRQL